MVLIHYKVFESDMVLFFGTKRKVCIFAGAVGDSNNIALGRRISKGMCRSGVSVCSLRDVEIAGAAGSGSALACCGGVIHTLRYWSTM